MAMKMTSLNIDLLNNAAAVVLADEEQGSHLHIMIRIETDESQSVSVLRTQVSDAARKALQQGQGAL